ncbi:MAG: hypothetical protein L0Y72_11535 [Gemmataceae bacterium]|nr:hypothetical protein [Gemmataceae bacterium]MCI0739669.1 hypothetical protein [Gemmataceae bacterium]
MCTQFWNETAKGFADYVRHYHPSVTRGAVCVQLDQEEQPSETECNRFVVGVFGNDLALGELAYREIRLIRRELSATTLQELGFGASDDGAAWALLIAEQNCDFQTALGKQFRHELLKLSLEDLIWQVWHALNCVDERRKR